MSDEWKDFPKGTKVIFKTDAERFPFFVVPKGTTGVVIDSQESVVWVHVDQDVPGLSDSADWKGDFSWQPDTIDAEFADPLAGVKADMALGKIPQTAKSFTELHDYVDANDYLQDFVDFEKPGADDECTLANKVVDIIDEWLKTREATP